jgi:tetratricopeptide (TPR) repeat protein
MRILSLIAVVLFVSALAAPTRADIVEDCVQSDDLDLKIGGCTAAIGSGQWQGKDLAIAYSFRGNAYGDLGEHARAIEDYDQALRLDPGIAYAYYKRGNAYGHLGEYSRAIEDYDQALRLDPDYANAYNNRAWALYLLGRNTEALGDVDRSLSLRPGDPVIIDIRAHVLAALGRRNEALGEFERVMRVGGADWVRKYQEALAKHGYYRGAVDGGAYRPQTRAALVACLEAGCRLLE